MIDAWHDAQAEQLSYQRGWAQGLAGKLDPSNAQMFAGWGFDPADYRGKTILDLCCGSRLRSRYFAGAYIIAMDSLAGRYLDEIPGCDLTDAGAVITNAAENNLPVFNGTIDFVLCINALDQCRDAAAVIGNISRYLKPGGRAFMTFDLRHSTETLFPLTIDREAVEAVFRANGLAVERFEQAPAWCAQVSGRAQYWLVKR